MLTIFCKVKEFWNISEKDWLNLSNRQFFFGVFKHKKHPGGASIHEIKESFPLKPSLEIILELFTKKIQLTSWAFAIHSLLSLVYSDFPLITCFPRPKIRLAPTHACKTSLVSQNRFICVSFCIGLLIYLFLTFPACF